MNKKQNERIHLDWFDCTICNCILRLNVAHSKVVTCHDRQSHAFCIKNQFDSSVWHICVCVFKSILAEIHMHSLLLSSFLVSLFFFCVFQQQIGDCLISENMTEIAIEKRLRQFFRVDWGQRRDQNEIWVDGSNALCNLSGKTRNSKCLIDTEIFTYRTRALTIRKQWKNK